METASASYRQDRNFGALAAPLGQRELDESLGLLHGNMAAIHSLLDSARSIRSRLFGEGGIEKGSAAQKPEAVGTVHQIRSVAFDMGEQLAVLRDILDRIDRA
jgi:hypothetical protein